MSITTLLQPAAKALGGLGGRSEGSIEGGLVILAMGLAMIAAWVIFVVLRRRRAAGD